MVSLHWPRPRRACHLRASYSVSPANVATATANQIRRAAAARFSVGPQSSGLSASTNESHMRPLSPMRLMQCLSGRSPRLETPVTPPRRDGVHPGLRPTTFRNRHADIPLTARWKLHAKKPEQPSQHRTRDRTPPRSRFTSRDSGVTREHRPSELFLRRCPKTWSLRRIGRASEAFRLTCTNIAGRGFFLSRASQRTF
jgi:hypothetical protein